MPRLRADTSKKKAPKKPPKKPLTPVQDATPEKARPVPPPPIRGAALGQAREPQLVAPTFPEVADPKKRAFLVRYAQTGKLADAAFVAGIDIKTGWNWRHDSADVKFLAAFKIAQGLAGDRLEAEIDRRAMEGVEEPVYQQGRLVGTVRKFSDLLLIFRTKGVLPEKYRERFEHSGPAGGPIETVDLSRLNVAELREIRRLLKAAQDRG